MTIDLRTVAALDLAPTNILIETYNAAATLLGRPTVKKFSDRKTALKRAETILVEAQSRLATLDAAKTAPAKKAAKAKAPKAERPETVGSVIKKLVLDGKDNAEIWAIVQPQFNMPDNHKHYPQWYRRQLNKAG